MSPFELLLDLLRASLEAAVVLLVVGLVVRIFPRMPAGARAVLWWIGSLRALSGCLALPGIPLPLLPAQAASVLPTAAARQTIAPGQAAISAVPAGPGMPDLLWIGAMALLLIWCAGFVGMLIRQVRDVRRVLGIWHAASPMQSPHARAWLQSWVGSARAARVELRMSAAVRAPLILGWGRPRILLPDSFSTGSVPCARMALAHETGHLLRRDLLWGWVPVLAECVFWFHPVVRWSVREYAQAREEACDAHAIELTGAEPASYGDMLVRFGVDRIRVGHAAASCGSPHARHLERRLSMLSHTPFQGRRQRAFALAAVLMFGTAALVPLKLVAETHEANHADGSATRSFMSWNDGAGKDFSYGLLQDRDLTVSGTFHDGDWKRLKKIQKEHPGRVFWFSLDDQDYVVDDPATLREVDTILEPQRVLGGRQAKLGAEQSELGARQSELGAQQSELGAKQARLSGQLSAISAQLASARSSSERRDLEERMDELQSEISRLAEQQAELGQRQSNLGAQQSELGEKQSELGAKQSEEAERARPQVRKLAEACVRDGRAKPWKD